MEVRDTYIGTHHRPKRFRETGCGIPHSISSQLAVVEIALEDHQLALFQIFIQAGCGFWQTPVAATLGPESIWTQYDATFGVQRAPVLEQSLQILSLFCRQRLRRDATRLILLGRCLVEAFRIH
jgi:hypothetical protein